MTKLATRSLGRMRDPRLVLIAALIAGVIAYLPVLRSPPWLDDYMYFSAARDMDSGHFVRLVLTPWSRDPEFTFTRDFWRPLSFLYFKAAEPVFGGRVLPYHLVNLGIHLVAVVLVWMLARRLDSRPAVAGVAALVFALYPGSNEAVSWISSVNSAALPLMLGSWLLFLAATREAQVDLRKLFAAASLFAVALTFRETAANLLAPIGLWFAFVQRRDQWAKPLTYLPFVPYAAVCAVYFVIRTKGFTEPAANPDVYRFGDQVPDHWWYFLKNAFLPFRDPVLGWRVHAQEVAGTLLLLAIPPALAMRRWAYLAVLVGLVVSLVPSAAATLGVGQRYLYFATPLVGILAGMAMADVRGMLERRDRVWLSGLLVSPEVVAVGLIAGVYLLWDRNAHWVDIGPERQQAWVEELRAEYPTLPNGGTLYCVNVPLELALYQAANLPPVVRWYYPGVGQAVWTPEIAAIPPLSPGDRVFIAGDGQPR